jgi:hypothetical protein
MMRRTLLWMALFLTLACNLPLSSQNAASPRPQEEPGLTPNAPTALPGGESDAPSIEVVPVAATNVQIEGADYQAFQAPGDPFRFVCPSPCTVDPAIFYAQYAGFHAIYEILLGLTGVDTLPELQPVDIHILDDAKCGKLREQRALAHSGWDEGGNAVVCSYFFEYAQGLGGMPYTSADALRPENQAILIHEYLHTIYFGRTPRSAGAMHDFVTPIAQFAWMDLQDEEVFCTYHPETPPGDYGGYLLQELCLRNGFHWTELRRSLNELDALYRSGGGMLDEGFRNPVPTMAQYRAILNGIVGSDTSPAFREACWPGTLFNEEYDLPTSCTDRTPTLKPSPIS